MSEEYPQCSTLLREQGQPYPRTCRECGLGPCKRTTKQQNTMSELKPFDLERAKNGEPFFYAHNKNPMYYICTLDDGQIAFRQKRKDGLQGVGCASMEDFCMLPRKVKRWHVIWKHNGYTSFQEAAKECPKTPFLDTAIIEHEWEE